MKTKRTISLALLALMLLTLLPQAAWAAPGTCPNCGANDWKQTADGSNCTFPGQIKWTCKKCGYYTYTDATKTNPNVHDWDSGTVIREASCTETGERIYHCHWNSAHTKTVTTRALGHNFVGGVCTRCGVSQITPGPTKKATKKPTSKPTPHVHQWDEGVITVPAGYLETGIKTFTCTLCGETREEQVPLLTTMGGMDIMDYISLLGGGEDVLDATDIPAPLWIVTQPEGGVISPGTQTRNEGGGIAITTTNRGSWSMFIEVEGGYAPYAYQWFKVTAIRQSDGEPRGKVCGHDQQYYETNQSGRYYCVVTDAVGDSVRSDIVDVKYALTITEQPQNANLNGKDSVVLTVRAQGKGGSI